MGSSIKNPGNQKKTGKTKQKIKIIIFNKSGKSKYKISFLLFKFHRFYFIFGFPGFLFGFHLDPFLVRFFFTDF
jgi:hypothetical protein